MTVPTPSLTERLVAIADRQPEAPFLHRPDRAAVRYGALAGQIRYVRERLRSWSIVPGDIVAGFERSRALMAMACASLPASSTFAPLGSTLATDAYVALLRRMRPRAVLAPPASDHPLRIAAGLLLYGAAMELAQSQTGHRFGDPWDWVADAVGLLVLVPLVMRGYADSARI